MNHVLFYKAVRMTRTVGAFFSLKAQAEPQGLDKYNPGSGSRVLSAGVTTEVRNIDESTLACGLVTNASLDLTVNTFRGASRRFERGQTAFADPDGLLTTL